jgi:hypothetical protein
MLHVYKYLVFVGQAFRFTLPWAVSLNRYEHIWQGVQRTSQMCFSKFRAKLC